MNTIVRKLHIGCFDQVLPGWINADITPHIFVASVPGLAFLLRKTGVITEQRFRQHREGTFRNVRYLNVARRFPYADETFDYIYSSHLLEHLYPEQARQALEESARVLKPGGILRLAVPDLNRLVADYDPRRAGAFLDLIFESGQRRDKNAHHWHYNERTLREALLGARFSDAYRCGFRQGSCADIEMVDSRPESLFMEGIK